MTKSKFGITEDGVVFLLDGGFRRLGNIWNLAAERTAVAREFQEWRDSGRPVENVEILELGGGRRRYVVCPAAQAEAEVGRDTGHELVEPLAA